MKKGILLCVLVLLAALLAMPVSANTCGENMTWVYEDGVLTITGTGKMDDFAGDAPWGEYKEEITKVVIGDGITYIGARAFYDYDALTEVEIGNSLYEIGEKAFRSCDGLVSITLPATFKIFGKESFYSCTKLEEIHCKGRFPTFEWNSMWNTYCNIYYPAEKPWGIQWIAELEAAFKGRIEFLASDGTDHYNPDAQEPTEPPVETTKPTEPPVETTVPTEPTTLPTEPTTVPTEPVTESTTAPSEPTSKPTEPALTEPVTRPTQPQAPEQNGGKKVDPTLWILLGVLVFALIVMLLIVKNTSRGGKYTRKRRKR